METTEMTNTSHESFNINKLENGVWKEVLSESFDLFKLHYAHVFLYLFLTIISAMAINQIPFIGGVLNSALQVILGIGFYLLCDQYHKGHQPNIGLLFEYFNSEEIRKRMNPLVIFNSAWSIIVAILVLAIGAVLAMLGLTFDMGVAQMAQAGGMAMILIFPLTMLVSILLYFSIPLMLYRKIPLVETIKLNLRLVTVNWLPLTVFALILFLLGIVCTVPFGLGLIILFPVICLSNFVLYRMIFGHE